MTEKERYDWDLNGIWDYNDESDEYIESYKDITKLLNEQDKIIKKLVKENKHLRCIIKSNSKDDYIDYLEKQNERLTERITELACNDKIVFMNR